MPSVDSQTMKEVTKMTESSEIGLDSNGRDKLRIEVGTVRDK